MQVKVFLLCPEFGLVRFVIQLESHSRWPFQGFTFIFKGCSHRIKNIRLADTFFQHISLSFALKIAHPTVVLLETVIFFSGCF